VSSYRYKVLSWSDSTSTRPVAGSKAAADGSKDGPAKSGYGGRGSAAGEGGTDETEGIALEAQAPTKAASIIPIPAFRTGTPPPPPAWAPVLTRDGQGCNLDATPGTA
jgi:hypothetical protein